MRKHKSVVAILLAVMMIFTFMPAMSFAYSTTGADGSSIDWGNTLGATTATLTDSAGKTSTCDVTYAVENNTGLIHATATITNNGVTSTVGNAYFYDLTGATVYNGGAVVKGNYNYAYYVDLYSASLGVKLAKPSYIKDAEWTGVATAAQTRLGVAEAGGNSTTSYTFTADGKADETATKGETKTVNVKITGEGHSATGDVNHPYLLGDTPTASVTITDGSDVAAAGTWYVDTVSKNNVYNDTFITYDGKEHTLIYVAPDNASVSYEKHDYSRRVWNATGTITVKNVANNTDGYADRYRAVYKDSKGATHYSETSNYEQNFIVNPATSKRATFGFKPMPRLYDTYDYVLTAEQAADPVKFVTFDKCVEGDEEALMNFFNDFYEVKVAKNASNANLQEWTIAEKYSTWTAGTTGDGKIVADLYKKYGTLLANYGYATIANDGTVNVTGHFGFDSLNAEALVKVDTDEELDTKTDDITFSGVTTKAFKAKKKTKKLAKTKTFKVAAAADSGNAITFTGTSSNAKVSISADGTVTVKKGLKKGAKVKLVVKAKTAEGNGYKACKESKTYTIKIK